MVSRLFRALVYDKADLAYLEIIPNGLPENIFPVICYKGYSSRAFVLPKKEPKRIVGELVKILSEYRDL